MYRNNILHICRLDKFIPSFIELIKENFLFGNHNFLLFGNLKDYPIKLDKNIIYFQSVFQIIKLISMMNSSEKIILHSLFNPIVVWLLLFQPWLLRKCYWVIWGGDLYCYKARRDTIKSHLYESVRGFVIKRLGHFVTYFKGEYELARTWYGVGGVHHECFTYPSNIFNNLKLKLQDHTSTNILVGNSATYSNQHIAILEKLMDYRDQDIKIFVPLSYGDALYADQVIEFGKSQFGNKFYPIKEFMPFDKYINFLATIDIAVFNNNRQQAVGNIISLIGLGKKVFMRTDVSSWKSLREMGVYVFDIDNLEISKLEFQYGDHNKRVVTKHFSKTSLIRQLEGIFL